MGGREHERGQRQHRPAIRHGCAPGRRGPGAARQEHEGAKADLKKLVPEDAKEAIGHGLRAKRSKSGAVSFDLMETADAPLQ